MSPTLFSYRIPRDYGSAPNPFWGLCTLAICKPVIRKFANIGDWVVGTGSSISPIGDISHKVVYAMRVTQKMTMKDYDEFTRSKLPCKIPLATSLNPCRRAGDSIYDYSTPNPSLREGVHNEGNRNTDLSGISVLLSNHFFYFGDRPVDLPKNLLQIVKEGQGHRSKANNPYVNDFVDWIHHLGYLPATLIGEPLSEVGPGCTDICGPYDRQEDEADLAEPDSLQ